MAFIYSPLHRERESTVKSQKGHFFPTMKGLKGTKMRVNTHVPGVTPAKSLFRMVRNPPRVERERGKKL